MHKLKEYRDVASENITGILDCRFQRGWPEESIIHKPRSDFEHAVVDFVVILFGCVT